MTAAVRFLALIGVGTLITGVLYVVLHITNTLADHWHRHQRTVTPTRRRDDHEEGPGVGEA